MCSCVPIFCKIRKSKNCSCCFTERSTIKLYKQQEFRVSEHKPLVLLAWPCNKPFFKKSNKQTKKPNCMSIRATAPRTAKQILLHSQLQAPRHQCQAEPLKKQKAFPKCQCYSSEFLIFLSHNYQEKWEQPAHPLPKVVEPKVDGT